MNKKPVGYQAIIQRLSLSTLPHYRQSYISAQGRGKTIIDHHQEIHIYPKTYALNNDDDLLQHLEFSIKYDGINLEIINSLFTKIDVSSVVEYIQKQPTGIYSRKIWFLYEFLMDDQLPLEDRRHLKYVNLLDPKLYFTSSSIKSVRHAINNNLLGNSKFCPFVRRTDSIAKYIDLHFDSNVKALIDKYDPHLIIRACNYLYTKETISSYQIEKEQPDKSRIVRFINLLQQAQTIESMSKEKLIELQNAIVDSRFKDYDYRQNQNYVGENINLYFQKIHYISPKPENVADIMQGLLDSLGRMLASGIHPVIVAAAISFGFVFIHPFEDGNGRIHRFLIHYILSKGHFTPLDMIFPVSSIMLKNMREYDSILEKFSKPLLMVLKDYDLTADGVMTVKQESKTHYQYLDFTDMTEYLFSCIEDAIHNQIEREIIFLVNYDRAKKAIQEIVDMPDNQIDLFIRFVIQNNGALSARKRSQYFELLTDDEIIRLTSLIKDYMLGS
jgi:hypothetical protein